MILNDRQIGDAVERYNMIHPYCPDLVRQLHGDHVVSYGQSSAGYDVRPDGAWKFIKQSVKDQFTPPHGLYPVLDVHGDPKEQEAMWETWHEPWFDIMPGDFVLCSTIEYFRIPDHIVVTVYGKSTYARQGIVVNVTPAEPGWHGNLTMELSNTCPIPVRVYRGEGLAQFVFNQIEPPLVSYEDRGGKYQNQKGVTGAKL